MIKIISGTYGYRDGGKIVPKNSKSEPFTLDKKEEERLVKAGVAAYVDVTETIDNKGDTEETEEKGNKGNKGKKGKNGKGDTEAPVDVPAPSFDAKGTVVN